MGYLSVKTMVDHLRGRTVPKVVDTGVYMVTLDNLDSPEIRAVLAGTP
jgi:ribose transport system substrate-binding protein